MLMYFTRLEMNIHQMENYTPFSRKELCKQTLQVLHGVFNLSPLGTSYSTFCFLKITEVFTPSFDRYLNHIILVLLQICVYKWLCSGSHITQALHNHHQYWDLRHSFYIQNGQNSSLDSEATGAVSPPLPLPFEACPVAAFTFGGRYGKENPSPNPWLQIPNYTRNSK